MDTTALRTRRAQRLRAGPAVRPRRSPCARWSTSLRWSDRSSSSTLQARSCPRRPARSVLFLAWWLGLSVLATGVLVVVDRATRKLLAARGAAEALAGLSRRGAVAVQGRAALRIGREPRRPRRGDEGGRGGRDAERGRSPPARARRGAEHPRSAHARPLRARARVLGDDRRGARPVARGARPPQLGRAAPRRRQARGSRGDPDQGRAARPTRNGRCSGATRSTAPSLVAPMRDWLGPWTDAVGYHHERWDGKGYPHGLAGEEIPLAGRIVAVADVFDVITSARSYKTGVGSRGRPHRDRELRRHPVRPTPSCGRS